MSNAEAIAFKEDHDRYMKAEDAANNRNAWIASKSLDLFNGEYSPYLPANAQETISELSSADALLFGAYVSSCATDPLNDVAAFALSNFLIDRGRTYWVAASQRRAETLFDQRGL